jgi:hypothetical protein
MRKLVILSVSMLVLSLAPAFAQRKDCEELKKEIAAKLDAKNIKNYMLEIIPAADVKDEKVVGTCDLGTKRVVYKRAG